MVTVTGGVRRVRRVPVSTSEAIRRFRRDRPPLIPVIVIGTLIVCAALAPLIAPHDPTVVDVLKARKPPGASLDHMLGTDLLGRDILSRLIYGSRTAFFMIVVALGSGALVGTTLGLVSGYVGGWVDVLIMRIVDGVMGFPTILIALVMVVTLGQGAANVILAVALTVWAHFARMVRGEALAIKQQEYVTLAKVAGVPAHSIITRHIFPNTLSTVAILTSLRIGQVVLLEASLSFLGLGLPPGSPSWGIMISEGRTSIMNVWWLSVIPGLTITAVVLSFNLFGDWLRDTLDPKLRTGPDA
jgi:peptide/nickel transport system permease protein